MLHLPRRDVIATGLVAVAVLLYLLWAAESAPFGLDGTRATGIVILGLGFAASASAVVPSFDQLLHGNRLYLVLTSLVGLVALIAGVQMLFTASETARGVVMAAMVVLWVTSTVHHVVLARAAAPSTIGAGGATRWPPSAAAH